MPRKFNFKRFTDYDPLRPHIRAQFDKLTGKMIYYYRYTQWGDLEFIGFSYIIGGRFMKSKSLTAFLERYKVYQHSRNI